MRIIFNDSFAEPRGSVVELVDLILRPKAVNALKGIVANLEYSQGKDGNYGVYLKMGYAY
jgi:hypothetical protein